MQPDVEAFLAAVLDKVLVAANPSRLKGLKQKFRNLGFLRGRCSEPHPPQRRSARAHQRRDGQRGGTRRHRPEGDCEKLDNIQH